MTASRVTAYRYYLKIELDRQEAEDVRRALSVAAIEGQTTPEVDALCEELAEMIKHVEPTHDGE